MQGIYSGQYQIEQHHIIYYYLDKIFLFNVIKGFQEIELNSVEADIIICINEEHELQKVWERIAREYNFSVYDEETQALFDSVISDFQDKELIEPGNKTVASYG